eukprot:scaffold382_cov380-Prasinococcus_capsulatus_cf.AAC.27
MATAWASAPRPSAPYCSAGSSEGLAVPCCWAASPERGHRSMAYLVRPRCAPPLTGLAAVLGSAPHRGRAVAAATATSPLPLAGPRYKAPACRGAAGPVRPAGAAKQRTPHPRDGAADGDADGEAPALAGGALRAPSCRAVSSLRASIGICLRLRPEGKCPLKCISSLPDGPGARGAARVEGATGSAPPTRPWLRR